MEENVVKTGPDRTPLRELQELNVAQMKGHRPQFRDWSPKEQAQMKEYAERLAQPRLQAREIWECEHAALDPENQNDRIAVRLRIYLLETMLASFRGNKAPADQYLPLFREYTERCEWIAKANKAHGVITWSWRDSSAENVLEKDEEVHTDHGIKGFVADVKFNRDGVPVILLQQCVYADGTPTSDQKIIPAQIVG